MRVEIGEVLGTTSHDHDTADHGTLNRLKVADRVVRETLRLHPAGVISPREAARDIEVGGYSITKGTLVLWSAHLCGRDPAVWNDPLRFDPGRFREMTEDQRAAAEAAWVPFGGGRRNCIGFALAHVAPLFGSDSTERTSSRFHGRLGARDGASVVSALA